MTNDNVEAGAVSPEVDSRPGVVRLASEFALIEVWHDSSANGSRLALRDVKSGAEAFFDPLELEALVYTRHEEFARFLDPGTTRWPGPPDV